MIQYDAYWRTARWITWCRCCFDPNADQRVCIPTSADYTSLTNASNTTLSASLWGTLNAPLLQPFLSNNPFFNGFPWGLLTAGGTNPYTNAPDTGVIRSYDFTLKRGQIAPDGYQKDVILINGQFPGPMMEANWGDTFRVTVHNQISAPEEGTSLHWHGILQKSTPWFDGVP